jgi:hypothetical protein
MKLLILSANTSKLNVDSGRSPPNYDQVGRAERNRNIVSSLPIVHLSHPRIDPVLGTGSVSLAAKLLEHSICDR